MLRCFCTVWDPRQPREGVCVSPDGGNTGGYTLSTRVVGDCAWASRSAPLSQALSNDISRPPPPPPAPPAPCSPPPPRTANWRPRRLPRARAPPCEAPAPGRQNRRYTSISFKIAPSDVLGIRSFAQMEAGIQSRFYGGRQPSRDGDCRYLSSSRDRKVIFAFVTSLKYPLANCAHKQNKYRTHQSDTQPWQQPWQQLPETSLSGTDASRYITGKSARSRAPATWR